MNGRTGCVGWLSTDSNEPGTVSTTPASTVIVRETETVTAAASPGVIVGSVVGGAAVGALVTLLVVVLLWFGRQKAAMAKGRRQDGNTAAAFEPASKEPGAVSASAQSPYRTGWAWDASGQHELHRYPTWFEIYLLNEIPSVKSRYLEWLDSFRSSACEGAGPGWYHGASQQQAATNGEGFFLAWRDSTL